MVQRINRRRSASWNDALRSERIRTAYAVIAFTTLIFLNIFHGLGILALILLTGLFALGLTAQERLRILKSFPLLAFPAFAILSTLWSDAPGLTLRHALQLAFTGVLGIALYHTLPFRRITQALVVVGLAACVVSLGIGGAAALQGVPLTGIAASKNMMAFFASTTTIAAWSSVLDGGQTRRFRLVSIVAGAIGLVALLAAQSAGASVSTVVGCAAVLAVQLFLKSSSLARGAVLAGLVLVLPVAAVIAPTAKEYAQEFGTDVLNKDTETLTGRTYLWDRARDQIQERPVLGHGFDAYWREGNPGAEGIWVMYDINTRTGFNFHNQYLESWVDLGIVGLTLFLAMLAVIVLSLSAKLVWRPNPQLPFLLGLITAFIMRLGVETSIFTPFSLLSLLFFMCGTGAVNGFQLAPAPARRQRSVRHVRADRPLVQARALEARPLRQTSAGARPSWARAQGGQLVRRRKRRQLIQVRRPPEDAPTA